MPPLFPASAGLSTATARGGDGAGSDNGALRRSLLRPDCSVPFASGAPGPFTSRATTGFSPFPGSLEARLTGYSSRSSQTSSVVGRQRRLHNLAPSRTNSSATTVERGRGEGQRKGVGGCVERTRHPARPGLLLARAKEGRNPLFQIHQIFLVNAIARRLCPCSSP